MESGGSTLSLKYYYDMLKLFKSNFTTICSDTILEATGLMKLIEEKEKIDGIVTFSSCGAFLSHAFDAPLILFSPAGPISILLAPGLGNPINPSIQPHLMAPFLEPMKFSQRIANLFLEGILNLYMMYVDSVQIQSIRENFGEDVPDFHSIMKERSAFAMSNSHFVTHGSWPYYQNHIEVGGIHCKPGKELPPDLKSFMDAHPEGVVYVSFGSALKPSQMTDGQKNVFRQGFRELKNIPIIWKWDDEDSSEIPENVLVQKWLPQNDLLAHPNLKVFVTHGGLLSTQEALFHSVPLVGIPISNDQKPNLMRAERHGYAKMLDLQSMTKEDLVSAINEAMHNEKMKDSMKKMHDLFTDDLGESPVKRAVRAVEFVIKHKGVDFLKPKSILSIPWYQERGFDILLFILVVLSVCCFIITKFCFCCISICCHKKTKQD